MTTILGLKTTQGPESIVLAADYLASLIAHTSEGGNGGILEQIDFRKTYCGENFAFTMTGSASGPLYDFWEQLKIDDKENPNFIDVESRLENEFFDEIKLLNLQAGDSDMEFNTNGQVRFIFATNYNEQPKLYAVYPMGAVRELKMCTYAGSGTDFIEERLSEVYTSHSLDGPQINLEQAINLADECITLARGDVFSKSIVPDLAIITPKSVQYYGDVLRERFKKFKERELAKIIKKYSK